MSKVVFDRYTSITSEQVDIVERKLNVHFPVTFRDMIQRYNGGRFNKRNCFNLFDTVFEVDSFMNFDLSFQDNVLYYNTSLYNYHIDGVVYFANTIEDHFIGLDYRTDIDNPSIVMMMGDNAYTKNNELALIADTFDAFIDMLIIPDDD
jgi:hypothetical protein